MTIFSKKVSYLQCFSVGHNITVNTKNKMSQQDSGEHRNPPVPNSPLRRSLRLRKIAPTLPLDLSNQSREVKRKLETTDETNSTDRKVVLLNEETGVSKNCKDNSSDSPISVVQESEAGSKLQSIKESDEVNEVDDIRTEIISRDTRIILDNLETESSCVNSESNQCNSGQLGSSNSKTHENLENCLHTASGNQIAARSHIKKKMIAKYRLNNNGSDTLAIELKNLNINEEIANSQETDLNKNNVAKLLEKSSTVHEEMGEFIDKKEKVIDSAVEILNQNTSEEICTLSNEKDAVIDSVAETVDQHSFAENEKKIPEPTSKRNESSGSLHVKTSILENEANCHISQDSKVCPNPMNRIIPTTQKSDEMNSVEELHVALENQLSSDEKITRDIEINHCEKKSDMIKNISDDIVTTEENNANKLLVEVSPTFVTEQHKQKHGGTNENIIKCPTLNSKIDELLDVSNLTSNESDTEHNSFLDEMAEEGEEDTPSEQSNDIIEVGEEINTTESELSSDQSYDRNSFIDDEDYQLLSGEEYDLSFESSNKKRKRIIQISGGSDEEIIRIARPVKKILKRPKKSRIIKFRDSSDEEASRDECTLATTGNEDFDVDRPQDTVVNIKDHSMQVIPLKSTEDSANSATLNLETGSVVKNGNEDILRNFVTERERGDEYLRKNKKPIIKDPDENNTFTSQTSNKNVALEQESICKKIVILENTKVEDICNKNLSSQINNVINSLFSGIENSSEVSINLSLDCSSETLEQDLPEDNQLKETKHLEQFADNEKPHFQETCVGKIGDQCSKNATLYSFDSKSVGMKRRKKIGKMNEMSHNNYQNESILRRVELVKHSNFENPVPVDKICHVLNSKKRSRRKHRKKNAHAEISTNDNKKIPLLQEAVMVNKHKTSFPLQLNNLDNKWDIQKITIKPSNCTNYPKQKQNYNGTDAFESKFHSKDFRNLMLYNSNRVKRTGTKQLIKKKSW